MEEWEGTVEQAEEKLKVLRNSLPQNTLLWVRLFPGKFSNLGVFNNVVKKMSDYNVCYLFSQCSETFTNSSSLGFLE